MFHICRQCNLLPYTYRILEHIHWVTSPFGLKGKVSSFCIVLEKQSISICKAKDKLLHQKSFFCSRPLDLVFEVECLF
jgi:hypothetical protein